MSRTLSTRAEFIEALRELAFDAAQQSPRELRWSDPDFADWPLNEVAVIDALTRWTAPGRRLILLAQHYDEVLRRHPRFVEWRRVWAHLVDARVAEELAASDHPSLWLAGPRWLQLLDRDHWRALRGDDEREARLLRDALDACLQRSSPGFPPTTLGL